MGVIINLVMDNLTMVMGGIGIFVLFWLCNFVTSIYANVNILKEMFEWKRMFGGIIKMIFICLGTGLFTVGVSVLPSYMQWVGLTIPQEYVDVISVLTVIIVYIGASLYYAKQFVVSLKDIFSKEVQETIDEFADIQNVEYEMGTDILEENEDEEEISAEDEDIEDVDVKGAEITE